MSNDLNKIKARIQALLAKANGTDNEHEAEAFLAKAYALLAEHQLDLNDLTGTEDPIINHPGLRRAESGHAWRWKLYSAVGRLYGCKSIHVDIGYLTNEDGSFMISKGKYVPGYEQRLVGRESAVMTAELMYPWIVSQVTAKAKEIAPLTGMSVQGQAKRVAAALISRINRLIALEQAKEQAPSTSAARNALVLATNSLVENKYAELYPDSFTMKSRSSVTDGLSKKAADSIGLHRQTGGKTQLRLGA